MTSTPAGGVSNAVTGLGVPDAIVEYLATADTPYRAWAAVALLVAALPRHRAEGRRIATELADTMPDAAQLDHADLVGYALLDGAGFLAHERRAVLHAALPRPYAERTRRARLFDSSTYVYLLARGAGATFPWTADLLRHVDEELTKAATRAAPDMVELALLLAARFELAEVAPIPEETLRHMRGRVAGAGDSPESAVAARWLLEVYRDRWPKSVDGDGLRGALRAYAEGAASETPLGGHRLMLLAMQLEAAVRRDSELRLTTRADQEAAVATHLGWRRVPEGAAYLFVLAALAAGPAVAAVRAGWFVPTIGWAAALGWSVPAAIWVTLIVLGRPRDSTVLGTGVVTGLAYAAVAFYAGWAHRSAWMAFLAGEGALLGLFVPAASSVVAGVKALRDRQG